MSSNFIFHFLNLNHDHAVAMMSLLWKVNGREEVIYPSLVIAESFES